MAKTGRPVVPGRRAAEAGASPTLGPGGELAPLPALAALPATCHLPAVTKVPWCCMMQTSSHRVRKLYVAAEGAPLVSRSTRVSSPKPVTAPSGTCFDSQIDGAARQ